MKQTGKILFFILLVIHIYREFIEINKHKNNYNYTYKSWWQLIVDNGSQNRMNLSSSFSHFNMRHQLSTKIETVLKCICYNSFIITIVIYFLCVLFIICVYVALLILYQYVRIKKSIYIISYTKQRVNVTIIIRIIK